MDSVVLDKDFDFNMSKWYWDANIESIDITLGELMEKLDNWEMKEGSRLILDCPYEWFQALLDEMKKEPSPGEAEAKFDDEYNIEYIDVRGLINIEKQHDDTWKNAEVSVGFDVGGISAQGQGCGIEFLPVYLLKDKKIKIGNTCTERWSFGRKHKYTKHRWGGFGKKIFTMRELIRALFWELTFCGDPKKRDAMWKGIEYKAEEAKRFPENLKRFNIEEFERELEEDSGGSN